MTEKITASHRERRAVVYMRQSSMKQVLDNKKPTARQYALRERAIQLGWLASRVDVIDSDLGHSGSTTEGRIGYQRLAKDVADGRIGAILALEVSRVARREADWYYLLDLCRFADVVIIDEQGVYAPTDPNDRLLLGLKGTMSEAEQVWMRLRLQGGALNKAKRGELRLRAPAGYEWDKVSQHLILSPLDQAQRAVRLVFERFRLDGSATGVARYFNRNGLLLPVYSHAVGAIHWVAPRQGHITHILRNPLYTGTYVYGRCEERQALVNGNIKKRRINYLPRDKWKVSLSHRHPAYIGWDEYMANQKKLEANRNSHESLTHRGAPREGAALLQGLLLCGRCGHRMYTYYKSGSATSGQYRCYGVTKWLQGPGECWSTVSRIIDAAVVERFLEVAAPDELAITLVVSLEAERQCREVMVQWNLRLERAHYEAKHAERRYKAVDPENRAVARTLEKDWNDKLVQVEQLEDDKRRAEADLHLNLTDEDRRRILELSKNLPLVWSLPTTTLSDKKRLLRLAIQDPSSTVLRKTCFIDAGFPGWQVGVALHPCQLWPGGGSR